MTEHWKSIPEYAGYYEASSEGRIRNAKKGERRVLHRILAQQDNGHGYINTMLSMDGIKKRLYVHRLVASAFLGSCPKGKEVGHLNHKREDNRAVNLTYVTRKENMQQSRLQMRHAHGERSGLSVLTEKEVIQIRVLYQQGLYSQSQLGSQFGIKQPNIWAIVNRKTWTHLTP